MQESQTSRSQSGPHSDPNPAPVSRGWRRWLKWTLIPLGSLLGLLLLTGLAVWIVLTPARLTPMVNDLASRYLNAEVRFEAVHLSLFRHFPHVSLQLKNGQIISHAFSELPDSLRRDIPAAADTLLRFRDFSVTLNVHALALSRLSIRRIELERPRIYAYVAPNGRPNWAIYAADSTDTDSASSLDMSLFVRRLNIAGGDMVYESRPESLYARVDFGRLTLEGKRDNRYEIDLVARGTVHQDTLRLCDTLPLSLKGAFTYDLKEPLRLGMDALTVGIADLPATFTGEVALSGDSIRSELNCRMNPWHLQNIIDLIPRQMMPRMHNFRTTLTADFNTTIRGTYNLASGALPTVSLDCRVDGGYLHYQGAKAAIDKLKLDMSLHYNPRKPDSTGVELRKLLIEGSGVNLRASGAAWNLEGNTRMRTQLEGALDLDKIGTLFPFPQGITAHGRVGMKLDASVRKNQLNLRQIGQSKINASIDLDNFLLHMPQDSILLAARGGRIRFGANESADGADSLVIPSGEQVVYLGVRADSLNVKYKYRLAVIASGAHIDLRNSASAFSGDTTVIHPFSGSAETRYLEINGLDSTWVKTEEATTSFSLRPSPQDPAVPLLNLSVGAMGLTMKSEVNFYQLNGTDLRLEATLARMNRAGQQQRTQRMLDSLQGVYPAVPRDSLFTHVRSLRQRVKIPDDFASEDIDMKVDDQIGALLRRWNAKGSVYAINGLAVTPYFPLPTSLKNVDITFTTNELDLNGTRIESGSSQMELTGKVSNIRRALLGRGNLRVGMQLRSDTLNLNELILAANAGLAYAESDPAHKDSVIRAASEENIEKIYVDTAALADQSSLLVIPANVEVDLDMEVNHGIYSDIVLQKVTGELIVRDRCLQLNGLKAVTDAGEMTLTALYATHSRQDITAGFDLEMHRMQVERLIKAVPSVDTLLPMLRSFEGVVDCQLAATVALDSAMNFMLPTLRGVGRIHGDSLVLLDGETFSEIARMMRFKNRQRNRIDHISVEMIIRDNQIELFPFIIEMDRYRAAMSGIQRLDMSFDYHISVLRSPIPFRLGINISGTPDKFKWRLGRARYKNVDVPTYVELIDSTRLNLKRTLNDAFRRGVQAASLGRLQAATTLATPSEIGTHEEALSPADSLLLRQSGVLPGDTLSSDTLPVPILSEPLPAGKPRSVSRSERKESRRSERLQKRNAEAALPEEENR